MFERASADIRAPHIKSPGELFAGGESTRISASGVTFVGRQAELRHLTQAVDAALMGRGSLVAVAGEPGIGKTALCEEVSQYAGRQGAWVVIGYSYQRGMSRPYLPFAQILHRFVVDSDLHDLRSQFGSNTIEVARIVPDFSLQSGAERRGSSGDQEEDQLRLFHAVSDFLCAMADRQPLVLIFEDLHDADQGTLDLLLHLSRQIGGARLLVVATYRDVAVERTHPLSVTLADLRRLPNVSRLALRGLSADEVQVLVEQLAPITVTQTFGAALQQQTEGNPLFVHELVRHLAAEGLLQTEGARATSTLETAVWRSLPEGLRDVVGKRLSRLSQPVNQLLRTAAVIGFEFRLDVLQPLVGVDDDAFLAALQESVAAGVIQEGASLAGAVTFSFAHAYIRQMLYEEMIAPRRIHLHQQIARALEAIYGRRAQEHAAELAEHFSYSTDPAELRKAVQYGQIAAAFAMDVFAYGEAVHQLERAWQVQGLLDGDDLAQRCDLQLLLGEAMTGSGELRRVVDELTPEAFRLAERLEDRVRAFRACRIAINALHFSGNRSMHARPEYLLWAQRADRHAAPETVQRAFADEVLAEAAAARGQMAEATALRRRALALAREGNDRGTMFKAAVYLIAYGVIQDWGEVDDLVKEFSQRSSDGVPAEVQAWMLFFRGAHALVMGQRARAERLWHEVDRLAQYVGGPNVPLQGLLCESILAQHAGRLVESVVLLDRLVERADRLGAPLTGRHSAARESQRPLLLLGRAQEYLDRCHDYERAGLVMDAPAGPFAVQVAICHAELGHTEEARAFAERLFTPDFLAHAKDGILSMSLGDLLQFALQLERKDAVVALAEALAVVSHLAETPCSLYSVGRLLGDAAALLGRPDQARAYYVQALSKCQRAGFRPEIPLIHLHLAQLLVDQYPHQHRDARAHLELASAESKTMGMQPSLERALEQLAKLSDVDESRAFSMASVKRSVSTPPSIAPLTPREASIAALLTSGLTNREIANTLVITEGTAAVHVKRIMSKLGLKSRTQVAMWASERGLREPHTSG